MAAHTQTASLHQDLKRALKGDVRFDAQAKALYATDASNYRQVPIGVICPKDAADVEAAMRICREHNVPVLSRGAGTSLAGQCCNVAVVFDFSRHMNRILEIDPVNRRAIVEPGVILDHLREEAEKYGLTFGPDPATHSRCTLGGMIGNNSCGVHAVAWGKTVDNVEALQILTYDGLVMDVGLTTPDDLERILRSGGRHADIYASLKTLRDENADHIRARFPKIPRRVSGYNLDELLPENNFNLARALVGSEGTCVTILKATLRLIPSPPVRQLIVLGYPSVYAAADAVPQILQTKPIGLEGMDLDLVSNLGRYQGFPEKIRLLPSGEAWLLVEYGGQTQQDIQSQITHLNQLLGTVPRSAFNSFSAEAAAIWSIRESVLAATAFVPGQRDRHEGWEDSAVPPEKLGAYLKDLRALYDKYGYKGAFYGHFGDGCLHTRIDFDLETEEGRQATREFLNEATDLVVRYGGSISGEHGDGQARGALLPKMYGPQIMDAFRAFKKIWDPTNGMNPGKMIDGYGVLDNLRFIRRHPGENRTPSSLAQRMGTYPVRVRGPEHGLDTGFRRYDATHFHYPKQENSFVRAILRCVGVGKCRNEENGLMCPSYQVTRDETHSTRGRAHLLFEMLKGETITGGWKSNEVKEALDLCLSCKGCKNECPTNVDMAAWKAEFLSHYYEGRLRPLKAYLYGYVDRWLRLGSKAPWLANLFSPGPRIAGSTFRAQWLKQRGEKREEGTNRPSFLLPPRRSVVLWPDTFTNYLSPSTGTAAAEVLEHLGYRVELPPPGLCCGRPLYDHGFLKEAKAYLHKILTVMKPQIEAGLPIVMLEPGCASVLKDELLNFFPDDPLAKKLNEQVTLFSEFLLRKGADLPTGQAGPFSTWGQTPFAKAILQTHCHHKSVMNGRSDYELLEKLGFHVQEPESGCCGMAGAFGLEEEHKHVSDALAERALAPAIRAADKDTLVIADGFSCREQIRLKTGQQARHVAEIVRDRIL